MVDYFTRRGRLVYRTVVSGGNLLKDLHVDNEQTFSVDDLFQRPTFKEWTKHLSRHSHTEHVDRQTYRQTDRHTVPTLQAKQCSSHLNNDVKMSNSFSQLLCLLNFITQEQSSFAHHCCPPLSPSSAVVLNHISSHFLIPLSDSSLI